MPRSVYSRLGQTTIAAPDQNARQHTVKGSEALQDIAQYEYPTLGYQAALWRQIATENEITDLDAIEAGDVLAIPSPASTS